MRMDENKKNKYNRSHSDREYLLSGLVFCEDCGSLMIGVTVTSKGYEYKRYACQNKRKFHTCVMKDIRGDHLEQRAYELISDKILSPESIDLVADTIIQQMAAPTDNNDNIKAELVSIGVKLNNMLNTVKNGLASDTLITHINALNIRKKI